MLIILTEPLLLQLAVSCVFCFYACHRPLFTKVIHSHVVLFFVAFYTMHYLMDCFVASCKVKAPCSCVVAIVLQTICAPLHFCLRFPLTRAWNQRELLALALHHIMFEIYLTKNSLFYGTHEKKSTLSFLVDVCLWFYSELIAAILCTIPFSTIIRGIWVGAVKNHILQFQGTQHDLYN